MTFYFLDCQHTCWSIISFSQHIYGAYSDGWLSDIIELTWRSHTYWELLTFIPRNMVPLEYHLRVITSSYYWGILEAELEVLSKMQMRVEVHWQGMESPDFSRGYFQVRYIWVTLRATSTSVAVWGVNGYTFPYSPKNTHFSRDFRNHNTWSFHLRFDSKYILRYMATFTCLRDSLFICSADIQYFGKGLLCSN